jgi:hypothetical protein
MRLAGLWLWLWLWLCTKLDAAIGVSLPDWQCGRSGQIDYWVESLVQLL